MSTTKSNRQQVLLIYDDRSPQFQWTNYSEGEFGVQEVETETNLNSTVAPRYNGTSVYFNGNDPGGGSPDTVVDPFLRMMTFSFQGVSAAFFGAWYPYNLWTHGTWKIDNETSVGLRTSQSGDLLKAQRQLGQWFTTPTLPDGHHTIEFQFQYGRAEIDYAVVTSGQSLQYDDHTTIIVDDDTPSEIYYFGEWYNRRIGFEIAGSLGFRYNFPFQNGTHDTTSVGSGFRFRFSGTSLRIYGFTRMETGGSFDLTYTLDNDDPKTRSHSIPPVSDVYRTMLNPENADMLLDWFPNWLLAEYHSLDPGEHTITVNLTRLDGPQTFSFDYLTYTPSFPSLASKPVYSLEDLALVPSSSKDAHRQGNAPVIVGSVVGGLAFIALLLGIGYFVWRRKIKLASGRRIDPFDLSTTGKHQTLVNTDSKLHSSRRSESSMTQVDEGENQDRFDYPNTAIGAPKLPTGPMHLRSRSVNMESRRSFDTSLPPPTYRSSSD